MNSSWRPDNLGDAFVKNFISFTLCLIINCINGAFVYTFLRSEVLQRDPRYVLYIHLVINDMILLTTSVTMQIITYGVPPSFTACSVILFILITINKNGPLTLAGMAVERYVAVCQPLRHAQMCTPRRAYAFIGLIWGVSVIPPISNNIILVVNRSVIVLSRSVFCSVSIIYNTPHHRKQALVVELLLLSTVFLTVTFTYLKVFFAARAASGSDQVAAKNGRNTILLHGVQLLICMLSYVSPIIISVLIRNWPQQRTTVLLVSFQLTNVLPRLLSPLIYGVRDRTFSSHMRRNFGSKFCSAGRKRVNDSKGLKLRVQERRKQKIMS